MQVGVFAYFEAFFCPSLSFMLGRDAAALATSLVQEVIDPLCHAFLTFASINSLTKVVVNGRSSRSIVSLVDDISEMSDLMSLCILNVTHCA